MHFLLIGIWTFLRFIFARVTGWALAWFWYILPVFTTTVLTAIGMGFVTYVGMDFAIGYATDILLAQFNNRPAEYVAILEYIGADDAISIFIAGMTTAATVKATSSATRINWMPQGRI